MIKQEQEFTKYEVARILGARALQIAMDAPLLVKIEKDELERIKFDPLKIAETEFNSGILPITVKRPLPKKTEGKLKREIIKKPDKDVQKKENIEEKEITEEGEIMELAKPEDEVEEEVSEEEGVE
ncbi:DNA-directed RNA polymerase subunit K [Candidatus Pacearchaeota archaeon]|nr:DNA-directed RNA polymerase subunit K [Candidatus Pacearchaeota archaeon]